MGPGFDLVQRRVLSCSPSPANAGEGWGEGLLSKSLPSSAFGTFSRQREKGKKHRGAWSASRATETVAAKHASFADERGTGTVTASEYDKKQR